MYCVCIDHVLHLYWSFFYYYYFCCSGVFYCTEQTLNKSVTGPLKDSVCVCVCVCVSLRGSVIEDIHFCWALCVCVCVCVCVWMCLMCVSVSEECTNVRDKLLMVSMCYVILLMASRGQWTLSYSSRQANLCSLSFGYTCTHKVCVCVSVCLCVCVSVCVCVCVSVCVFL